MTVQASGERVDPWRVLGLGAGATPAEARAAWRAMARRHHPDRGGDTARFIAAQRAWLEVEEELSGGAGWRGDIGQQADWRRAAPPDQAQAWTHARAVRYLARKVEADIETMDDGTTGVAAREIVWLSSEGIEWEGFVVPWEVVDDQIMADVVELISGSRPG